MTSLAHLLHRLARSPAVLVEVVATQGSAPREAGTWMAVFALDCVGTIGGGRLEFDAIAEARAALAGAPVDGQARRYALGPSLGQCCGGVVHLRYTPVGAADIAALRGRLARADTPVALFGGGHVGAALARVLATLPFALTWIDSRDGIFPADIAGHADGIDAADGPARPVCEHSDPVHAAVPALAPQSRVLIMSFSHAEDLDIVAACLARRRRQGDLPFIGLIGSHTKWATFRSRLSARGFSEAELAAVTCPIGVPGIAGKQPEVIAVAVAAQLLQTLPR
ncbi:xanthine dehydrogenase accessory protein XdhC [Xylophilus sp. Kf1]|nr:xanthine dehydrogenase accessory protein XdhC [Xylophilus sp. Kf1]